MSDKYDNYDAAKERDLEIEATESELEEEDWVAEGIENSWEDDADTDS